jgi:nucleoside-diphosphate-sugar epimerase
MGSMEIKNVLVTGFDGYIGAVLTQLLLKNKFSVTGLDNFYFKDSKIGKPLLRFKQIKKDIRKIKKEDLIGFDVVIHLAALSNDPLGEFDTRLTHEINYKATVKLAKLAKEVGVKRFIFSSSCSVYGIVKSGIASEKTKVNPITAYSKSKINAEIFLKGISSNDFCVIILRNSTVYGFSPNLRADLVVNDFVTKGFLEKEIEVLSDGSPWRPLIDIRDLSEIFIKFLKIDKKIVNGQIFNIGFNENNFQVKDILDVVKKELPDCRITYNNRNKIDKRSYRVNFSKFHRTFPLVEQQWTLKKSVKDLVSAIKAGKIKERSKYFRLNILLELVKNKKLDNKLNWKI